MKIIKHEKEISFIAALFILTIIFSGCVASSSYYSGRTLEKSKFALSASADDIIIKDVKSSNTSIGISKDLPFAPSVGFAVGLPLQIETGVRWYLPKFIELSLRDQVTPRNSICLMQV